MKKLINVIVVLIASLCLAATGFIVYQTNAATPSEAPKEVKSTVTSAEKTQSSHTSYEDEPVSDYNGGLTAFDEIYNYVDDNDKIFAAIASRIQTESDAALLKKQLELYNDYIDLGYKDSDSWDNAQGLAADSQYYYFGSNNDKKNELSDIYVIQKSTMRTVRAFIKSAPPHCAEIEYAKDRGTLLACSGSSRNTAEIWELDKRDGDLLDSWDLSSIGYCRSMLMTYVGDGVVITLTSRVSDRTLAIDKIKLKANGKYEVMAEWIWDGNFYLGVSQGLAYHDGYVYYLADAGLKVSQPPHIIYKIPVKGNSGKVKIEERYGIGIKAETEGIFYDDGYIYFSTSEEKIYRTKEKVSKLKKWTL